MTFSTSFDCFWNELNFVYEMTHRIIHENSVLKILNVTKKVFQSRFEYS